MVLENFGIDERHPMGLTNFQHHLYMVAQGDTTTPRNRKAALYRIGAVTGAGARVSGTSDADDFGVGEEKPVGLVSHNNKLYMVGDTKRRLYEVDHLTGRATAVRSEDGIEFGIEEENPQAMAYHIDKMYFIGNDTDYLSSLNLSTGIATRVGMAINYGLAPDTASDTIDIVLSATPSTSPSTTNLNISGLPGVVTASTITGSGTNYTITLSADITQTQFSGVTIAITGYTPNPTVSSSLLLERTFYKYMI